MQRVAFSYVFSYKMLDFVIFNMFGGRGTANLSNWTIIGTKERG